VFASVAQVVEQ